MGTTGAAASAGEGGSCGSVVDGGAAAVGAQAHVVDGCAVAAVLRVVVDDVADKFDENVAGDDDAPANADEDLLVNSAVFDEEALNSDDFVVLCFVEPEDQSIADLLYQSLGQS